MSKPLTRLSDKPANRSSDWPSVRAACPDPLKARELLAGYVIQQFTVSLQAIFVIATPVDRDQASLFVPALALWFGLLANPLTVSHARS